jgi:hypothetical protein
VEERNALILLKVDKKTPSPEVKEVVSAWARGHPEEEPLEAMAFGETCILIFDDKLDLNLFQGTSLRFKNGEKDKAGKEKKSEFRLQRLILDTRVS